MDVEKLARAVDRALGKAHKAIRSELLADPYGVVASRYGRPGSWETAEAIGILRWEEGDRDLLTTGVEALLAAQKPDGGFAPWPDVDSVDSSCESTARVLLTIAPVCALAPGYEALRISVRQAATWIFRSQDESGGWGAYQGAPARIFPTCFAIQALAAARRAGAGVKTQRCGQSISRGAEWIEGMRNDDDGGCGTRPGEKSNHASSCQAAWGLTAANMEVPPELREYVLEGLGKELPFAVEDPVDDHALESGGRRNVTILSAPMALVGAVSVRADIYEERIIRLVESLLAGQSGGIWKNPGGRVVWPTHMHVAALRLWLSVHRSFAQASTSDFRNLKEGSVEPREEGRTQLRDPADEVQEWDGKLELLTKRERDALAAYVRGEAYKVTGEKLGLSYRTVENYKQAGFQKLGLTRSDRDLAFELARRAGLVPDQDEILSKRRSNRSD